MGRTVCTHLARYAPFVGALALAGCLGDLGGEPRRIRYFSPEWAPSERASRVDEGTTLRLRRVTGAAHLRDRIVWRTSEVEYGYYELNRWTEAPDAYVERGLATELFERRGFTRTEALDAPALDVRVAAFEEVISPHEARVALRIRLMGPDANALLVKTVTTSHAIQGVDPADVAEAMSRALEGAVVEAAQAVQVAIQPTTDGDGSGRQG